MAIFTIILGAILYFAIGMAWYKALAKPWCDAHHKQVTDLIPNVMQFAGAIVVALFVSAGLFYILNGMGIDSLFEGIFAGAVIGITIPVASMFSGVIWAGHPLKAFLIDAGCEILAFAAIGGLNGLLW